VCVVCLDNDDSDDDAVDSDVEDSSDKQPLVKNRHPLAATNSDRM